MSPEDLAKWYRERGYDFLAVTDHGKVTQVEGVDGLLCIPGLELNTPGTRPGRIGLFHVVGLGVSPDCNCEVSESPQELIDQARDAGGLAVIAHPHWSGNVVDEEFLSLEGYIGIECFNYGCEVENHTGPAEIYWDLLLLHGRKVLGLATDDSHRQVDDGCGGWVMVKAPELTQEAILAALRAGHFYSSSGPTIHDVRFDGEKVTVHCSPVRAVHFMTGGPWGTSVRPEDEDALLEEASYTLRRKEKYLRVEVVDRHNRVAWTNPIFVK